MTVSKAKSLLIILLAALLVYQTGLLWFVNITNRHFFLNYLPFLHQAVIPERLDRLVRPRRIITIYGDGTFSAKYSRESMSYAKHYGDVVISHLLQSGSFAGTQTVDYGDLLAYPAYIYEYAFYMEPEWFTKGFGQRNSVLMSTNVGLFNRIIIRPPIYEGTDAEVFFICMNGYAHQFMINPPGGDGPDTFDHEIIPSNANPSYAFIEPGGEFIRSGDFNFYGMRVINPYADVHRGLSMDFVMEQVAVFFNNPTNIQRNAGDEVWVYIQGNTVVRYYANQVLEYINYRTVDRSAPSTFLNDFSSAVQFVEADHLIANDFYLADFREEDGQWIFYFDYVIGDNPIIMPDDWPRDADLPAPIVVNVYHGTVVRYRKIALNFHVNEDRRLRSYANFEILPFSDFNLSDLQLGFRMSDSDQDNLFWFLNGRRILLSAENM
jgi:hypothetical protein